MTVAVSGTGAAEPPGATPDTAEVWERRMAERARGRGGWRPVRALCVFAVSALAGVGLRWLVPGWWPLGAVVSVLGVAGVVGACVALRMAGRSVPLRTWAAEAQAHTEALADRLPLHLVRVVWEARTLVERSWWRWPGVYVFSPPCRHPCTGSCTGWACQNVSASAEPWAIIVIGRCAFAGAATAEARARVLSEAEQLRSWRPAAPALRRTLLVAAPALAAWAAAPNGVVAAVLGVYLTVVGVAWAAVITADLAVAHRVDPRAVVAAARTKQRRIRAARRRERWPARAAGFLLPCYPPTWLRRRLVNNRISRRRYYRNREVRRHRRGTPR